MVKKLIDFLTEKPNVRMLEQVFNFPMLLKKGIIDAKSIADLSFENIDPNNVTICWYGMGASALIGEYIKHYVEYSDFDLNVDIQVKRCGMLKCDHNSLYIFYSYSGNTLETLMAFNSALKKVPKNRIIVFSTGGKIAKKAQKENIAHIPLVEGYVSRSHLPYGIATSFSILSRIFNRDVHIEKLENISKDLQRNIDKISDNVDLGREFNLLAKKMEKKVAIVVADYQMAPVAKRFMAQLNENSKHLAAFFEVPEGCHNFIVGLRDFMKRAFFVVIRRKSEEKFIRKNLDIVESRLTKTDTIRIQSNDNGVYNWKTLLEPTIMVDILSVFLADVKGKSAFDIKEITTIKEKMMFLEDGS